MATKDTETSIAIPAEKKNGFFGAAFGRIDDKNRIALPTSLRNQAVGDYALLFYYVTPRANIRVVSSVEWSRMQARFEHYGSNDPHVETFSTLMMDMSGPANLDTQGRLLIKEDYLPLIGIGSKNRDVRIAGFGGAINIWAKERIEAFKGGERLVYDDTFRQYLEAASKLVL